MKTSAGRSSRRMAVAVEHVFPHEHERLFDVKVEQMFALARSAGWSNTRSPRSATLRRALDAAPCPGPAARPPRSPEDPMATTPHQPPRSPSTCR